MERRRGPVDEVVEGEAQAVREHDGNNAGLHELGEPPGPSSVAARREAEPRIAEQRQDPGATLDDVREAVTTLEDTARIRRRVLGGNHPVTTGTGDNLRYARAALRARETPAQNAVDAS